MKRRVKESTASQIVQGDSNCEQHQGDECKDDSRLRHWHEVPEYMQFNEFIRSGYRANFSWEMCLKSLFQMHNETGNIWSHLLGALLFFFFSLKALYQDLWEQPFWGGVCFITFLISAQYAFGTSTLYHLFMAHSEHTLCSFLRMDYSGIAALIVGSYFSPLFLWLLLSSLLSEVISGLHIYNRLCFSLMFCISNVS